MLRLIALRQPLIYEGFCYSYTLLLFTTPYIAYSLFLSGLYIFAFRRSRKVKPMELPKYPDARERKELYLVLGEVHDPRRPLPAEQPYWLKVPERGLFTGIAIFGAIGTGKTSGCMYPYAEQLIGYQAKDSDKRIGGLVLEVTGTGKTTLLNIHANFIPDGERVLVIEDTAEIQIRTPNLVRFEACRAQNDLSAVTIRELLKATLRHRPDRSLLGEIRGGEAFDLLQLLNTGHSGTLLTVHANSAQQALSRFTTSVLQSEMDLPYRAIKSNIADSLNWLVQIDRRPGRRFVSRVLEITGYAPETAYYEFAPISARQEEPEYATQV